MTSLQELRKRLLKMQKDILSLRQITNDPNVIRSVDVSYYDEKIGQILEEFPLILEHLRSLEKPTPQDVKGCEQILDAMVEDFLEDVQESIQPKDKR
ncbi:hypothetical protein ACFOPX_08300 [Helicobacter baculiformis]|uniref:Uncharacterized protein n=1 Tax=Helicobacter baculiformis TaxID=427351 RepID=A0ABV7ZLY9_9HELI|nr:hypothetical protein [Helicobacter baculiformis]